MTIFKGDVAGPEAVSLEDRGIGEKAEKVSRKEKRRQKKAQKPRKRILIRLFIVVLAAALVVMSARMLMYTQPAAPPGTPTIEEKYRTPQYLSDKTMNILVCGIDTDAEHGEGDERTVSMTDVIMVVNFDREADRATVLQIPRDTYVGDIVPYSKINGLYQWGVNEKKASDDAPAIGIEPLIRVINEQFKLTIDAYVLITMDGFRSAVDLIGGVDIVLSDDEEPIDFEGHFVIKPGVNHLNGELAEIFVRYRNYERADIDRLRMQERVMEALMRKLFELSSSELISTVWKIRDHLVSDLDVAGMIAILREVRQMSMDSIAVIRVPGEPVSDYGIYGVNVFTAHKKPLADLLNKYMRPYQEDVQEAELGIIEIQRTREDFVDGVSVLGRHD